VIEKNGGIEMMTTTQGQVPVGTKILHQED